MATAADYQAQILVDFGGFLDPLDQTPLVTAPGIATLWALDDDKDLADPTLHYHDLCSRKRLVESLISMSAQEVDNEEAGASQKDGDIPSKNLPVLLNTLTEQIKAWLVTLSESAGPSVGRLHSAQSYEHGGEWRRPGDPAYRGDPVRRLPGSGWRW